MKNYFSSTRIARIGLAVGLMGAWLVGAPTLQANPPAPYNLIYGVVRDMYGTPLTAANVTVLLQTPSGVMISGALVPGYAPGVNYRLKVPMDSGNTAVPYLPNALVAPAQFKLLVVINGVTNLPIEMKVSYAALGQPGKTARIDLTLGVDANGDGIPDAWEYAFLATLGVDLPLASLNGNTVLTPDGLNLRQQYLFGTYPFNPDEPCVVNFMGIQNGVAALQFPTITGRYYSVQSSPDATHWTTASFLLPADGANATPRTFYYAPGIATAEVHLPAAANGTKARFFRLVVQ